MINLPHVTVIIPTRNRWSHLTTAVASAIGQRGVAVEVIIVDDGSDDSTPAYLASIEDPRVKVVRHPYRKGVARARNAGIARASAPWVAFLDDDDLWAPEKLRKQLDAAREADGSYAYTGAVTFDADLRVTGALPAPDPVTLSRKLLDGNIIPGGCSNVIALTEVIRHLGGFDEALSEFADWDLWLRLTSFATGAACDEPLVGHLDHAGNMLTRDRPNVLRELAHVAAKYAASGSLLPGTPSRTSGLRWAASEHYRYGDRLTAARIYLHTARVDRTIVDVARALIVLSGSRGVRAARCVRGTSQVALDATVGDPPDWLRDHHPQDIC